MSTSPRADWLEEVARREAPPLVLLTPGLAAETLRRRRELERLVRELTLELSDSRGATCLCGPGRAPCVLCRAREALGHG